MKDAAGKRRAVADAAASRELLRNFSSAAILRKGVVVFHPPTASRPPACMRRSGKGRGGKQVLR